MDLGEGEPESRTRALLEWVDSANIACGGHAGDDLSMRRCLELTRALAVRAGAHPGIPDRSGFGRGPVGQVGPGQLATWVEEQVTRLQAVARMVGTRLRHVKLHGTLYHLAETEPALAREYLAVVRRLDPALGVMGRCGGVVAIEGRRLGMEVWEEGFLDRGYRDDGTLVPRGEPGALVVELEEVVERLRALPRGEGWRSVQGRRVYLVPGTLCVHGDGPRALEILEAARRELTRQRATGASGLRTT